MEERMETEEQLRKLRLKLEEDNEMILAQSEALADLKEQIEE